MKKNYKVLKNILLLNDKTSFYKLLLIISLGSIFDAISVASMFPVVLIITSPDTFLNNVHILYALEYINKHVYITENELFIYVLSGCAITITISAFVKFKYIFKINNYLSNLQHNLTLYLIKKQLTKPYEYFVNENSSNLTNTIVVQADKFINLFVRNLLVIIASFTSLILIFTFLLYINYSIALYSLFALSFLFFILYSVINRKVRLHGQESTIHARTLNLSVSEIYRGIKAFKLLSSPNHCLNKISKTSELYKQSFLKCMLFQSLPSVITESIIYLLIILSVLIIILYSYNFHNEILYLLPVFGTYVIAVIKIKPHVSSILTGILHAKSALASAEYIINEFNEYIDSITQNKNFKFIMSNELTLKNMCFKYKNSNNYVLKNINISIKCGSFTGIVGSTGAGKSTLMDILLGLLEFDSGSYAVDDIEINSSNVHHLQSIIGYVPQEIFLSDTTIAQNIAFGQNVETIDTDYLEYVCKATLVDEFIGDLTSGYNSSVGETGIRFSGGQKQRIGLARALYLKPSILVLDEATSALDSVTESKILNSLKNFDKNMSIIMVTHRLSTLINCDQVICLKKGVITFQGTYSKFRNVNNNSDKLILD